MSPARPCRLSLQIRDLHDEDKRTVGACGGTSCRYMGATQHDLGAIVSPDGLTRQWLRLNYDGVLKSRGWLLNDPRCQGLTTLGSGLQCHENQSQGGEFGSGVASTACALRPAGTSEVRGDPFLVVPLPERQECPLSGSATGSRVTLNLCSRWSQVDSSSGLTELLLEKLLLRWRDQGAPVVDQLAPGLTDEEMDRLVAPLGLRVPPEARVWWGWHNGAGDAPIVINGGKAFSSLQRCVDWAERMRGVARDVGAQARVSGGDERDEVIRSVWNWDWLPLCIDGLGGVAVIEAGCASSSEATSIVRFRYEDEGSAARLLTPSIGALVQRWIIAMDAGAVTYDPEAKRWGYREELLPYGFDEQCL